MFITDSMKINHVGSRIVSSIRLTSPISLLLLISLCGCENAYRDASKTCQEENMNMRSQLELVCDMRTPDRFVTSVIDRSHKEGNYSISLTEPMNVCFVNAEQTLSVTSQLITVDDDPLVKTGSNGSLILDGDRLQTIRINSVTSSFDKTVACALKLCELVGIGTTELENWRLAPKSASSGNDVFLKTGENNIGFHAIEIREGIADKSRWRVLYALSREKSRDESKDAMEEPKVSGSD